MYSKQLVHLRPIAVSDAAYLFAFWSDPEVTAFMNISPMQRVEQAEEMIAYITQLNNANRYTIVLNEHTIIGTCGFNYIDSANQRGEIGYELGKKYWRKGYMSQALQALLQEGYFQLDLNRIEAKVEPKNSASRMLLEKFGFRQEGTLRQYEKRNGVFLDMIFYSLLQTDYTAI
ncbi:GNAT family N-acetyltransferase [Terribacillus sp. DMT04]|uniref:GNAT family N-acetyltransferase n=1 Tax=Terribacillus sp. DMT04 TaxID=2850441 RepID=UPI001C2C4A34|nr:GNAT family N-acetyltransferase [Terribacillus sp. DMT04]QXE01598.1 GNAT family N-acetyltransferase [Terribacillus sp. DMT04]